MPDVSKAVNIADLRLMAKRRLPQMVFDYIDGGDANHQAPLEAHYALRCALRTLHLLHLCTYCT